MLRWTGFALVTDLTFLVSETESIVQNEMQTLSSPPPLFFFKANCQFSSWAKVNSALPFFFKGKYDKEPKCVHLRFVNPLLY